MAKSEKGRGDYTVADVAYIVADKVPQDVARVSRMFPVLVTALLTDPVRTLGFAFGDKKAVGAEYKVRETFGFKADPDEAAVNKEIAQEPAEAPEPAPAPAPTPAKSKDKPKPAPVPAAPAAEPAKAPKKKDEDDLDALLNELEDATPGDADAADGKAEGNEDD